MSSLFNITAKHLELLNKLEDSIMENDVPDDDIVEQLNITEQEAKDKMLSYYYFIRHKEGECALIDDEIDRLNSLKKNKENVIKRLKDNVNVALQAFGEKSKTGNYKMDLGTVKVWNVFHKPLVLEENWENPDYGMYIMKNKVDKNEVERIKEILNNPEFIFNPDKKLIKDRLQSGEEIEGATINTDASYVRFK